MQRIVFVLFVALVAGCAGGAMPDTQTRQFWIDRDARMSKW